MQAVVSAALAAALSVANAWGGVYTIEVRNGAHARRDAVVSQAVTRDWVRLAESHALVETTGGQEAPVPFALDPSGEAPVLSLLLRGETAADARRTFAWAARRADPSFASDLTVFTNAASIAVSNAFFMLRHPARGGGGFPCNIAFSQSKQADEKLYFLDRAVRAKAEGGALAAYCAKDCEDAEAHVVFASPLRFVVEARTGFGRRAADTPGRPRAVYRYAYTANSPVVEVSARYVREDDAPWRELHFLHLTRADRHYAAFETGEPAQTHPVQPKGARSRAVSAPQWALMTDGTNACGVGCDGALCWDASDEFVYYVRRACTPWEGRTCGFDGSLYFGPAGGGTWYASWLGSQRQPDVRVFKDGRAWVPVEKTPARGELELRSRALKLAFAGAERGFDCVGVENRLAGGARFVSARDGQPGLWSLTFGGAGETAKLDNRSAARRVTAERSRDALTFRWQGLDLPGEPGCVDVRADVRLAADASEWRIAVTNRSARYGLFSTEYPLLRGVVPRGQADVLLPRGNWGGSLLPHFAGTYAGRYPSHACPVQMMAFQLGEAGLYMAAHDGGACAKELAVSREMDVTFRLPAADAGVPGAAGAPDFPVVLAAYAGDWWEAARRYRGWATRQAWASKGPLGSRADYPSRMRDLGFWMLLSGAPDGVAKNMEQAAKLYPGLPLGVHWYCWHQIPFDNSYPEYFPTKPGMPEATRTLSGQGVTVMPYINARLWDRDIPSFAGANAASCKQPSGTNYVETYGSGRNLVPMCPYTKLWQEKVQEVCGRLLGECGVGGIYLDQIGSAAPVLCYDASHGHPVGGGRHWVDGYHAMLRQVKAEAARRGALLTTEDSAEPYMDVIDGCLAWNERRAEDVPLLPAVYSGYTVYFTSPQAANDSLDAFCAAQGRDFLWGCQLGWNDPWILREEHRDKQRFQLELCRCRLAAKEFLVCGQLVDELRLDAPSTVAKQVWNRRQPHEARLPVVMGTVWRDPAGRLAVFIVNTSGSPQQAGFKVEPARWSGRRGAWRVRELAADGARPVDGNAGRIVLGDLPPRSVRALVFETVP